jgi:hypothetical protein
MIIIIIGGSSLHDSKNKKRRLENLHIRGGMSLIHNNHKRLEPP